MYGNTIPGQFKELSRSTNGTGGAYSSCHVNVTASSELVLTQAVNLLMTVDTYKLAEMPLNSLHPPHHVHLRNLLGRHIKK